MDWNKIGMITKPQALKGEFRLKPTLLNLKSYKKITKVRIENNEYNVIKVTLRDTFVIFKLEGIETCDQAEMLRNKEVFASINIDTNEHFDLLNFEVVVDNQNIGIINSIDNFGSKDILSIVGKNNIMLPVIDNLITEINADKKLVTLNKEIFEQVVVYED